MVTALPSPSSSIATQPISTPQGYALEIPLASFLHNVLPSLNDDFDPGRIVESMLSRGGRSSSHKPITLKRRWRGFAEDPAKTKYSEKKSFRHLQTVVNAIVKASGTKNPPVTLRDNPKCVMTDVRRDDDTFPDAYLTCGAQKWTDIIAFGELRKADTQEDETDNISKVTKSMARCMYNDPRRRFLFAFTIENATMKLWFCDRSQILVSEPFNFIMDHEPVVHFFLSLMYANLENMGIDPTMILSEDGSYHDITVFSDDGSVATYRTLKLLAEYDRDMIRGKGTRVWKTIKIEDGRETGEPVVLKDVWSDLGRSAEGVILNGLNTSGGPVDQHRQADGLFVTMERHGDVRLIDGSRNVLDCTHFWGSRGTHPNRLVQSRDELKGATKLLGVCASDKFTPTPLVHYRIVFKEICKPLDDETSFPKIFSALAQAALALKAMHGAGWVHRDVSTRNILLKDNGRALLADFEYAKKMGPDDEFRIGTTYFIVVEIASQRYKLRDVARSPDTIYEVEYNPLHDLESLWWIAVYVLVMQEIVDSAIAQEDQNVFASEEQRRYAAELFYSPSYRSDAIVSPGLFLKDASSLPPSLFPIADRLDALRWSLNRYYFNAERRIRTITHTCADGLHEEFHDTFRDIAQALEHQTLVVRPFTPYRNPFLYRQESSSDAVPSQSSGSSSKRKRSELQEDSELIPPGKQKRPYLLRRAKMRAA